MQRNFPAPLERLFENAPKFLRRVPHVRGTIQYRPVETVDELKTAAQLLYQGYLRRGYANTNPAQMRLSIYHALPETTTFVAIHPRLGIVGTLALIEDSRLGLPMDEVYKSELDTMRRSRHRLAEASMLALNNELFGQQTLPLFHMSKFVVTLRLFKAMFDYLRGCTAVTELAACFNPRHQVLYDFLHLEPLAGLRSYARVNGHPAIARHLNIAKTKQVAALYPVLRFFYGKQRSVRRFANKLFLSAEELYELFIRSTSIFASASRSEMEYVRSCYPTYGLDDVACHASLAGAQTAS